MQTKRLKLLLGISCLLWALESRVSFAAPASVPVFHVTGAVSKPMDWTVAKLGKDLASDVQTVHYTLKGVAHTDHCVPLLAVIQASQPAYNPHIKNHRLQFMTAVQGFDGY